MVLFLNNNKIPGLSFETRDAIVLGHDLISSGDGGGVKI